MSHSTPPLLDALAISYSVKGHTIPANISLQDRRVFISGTGAADVEAYTMAVQDRASSLANALGSLIAQSGDPALIKRAEGLIEQWNSECGDFINVSRRASAAPGSSRR